jgi:hypothetical protein
MRRRWFALISLLFPLLTRDHSISLCVRTPVRWRLLAWLSGHVAVAYVQT